MYKTFIKRYFDIVLAIIFLILFIPIYSFVYLYLLFTIGSPVIFKDVRAGKNGKPFILFKFRTMTKKTNNDYGIGDDRKIHIYSKYTNQIDEIKRLVLNKLNLKKNIIFFFEENKIPRDKNGKIIYTI